MKSKSFFNFFSILVAVVAATSLARAEDPAQVPVSQNPALQAPAVSSGAGSNSATVTQPDSSAYQKLEMTYFGVYYGPSLGTPGNAAQINPLTNQNDPVIWPQVLENSIKMNYYLSPNVSIGPVLNFYAFPGQTTYSTIQDSGVRIADKHLIQSGGLNLSADFRVLAPLSNTDIAGNQNVTLESVDYLKYDIPNSKWTVAFLAVNKYFTYNQYQSYNFGPPGTGADNFDFDLYGAPNFNWQFSPKVALTGFFEFYPGHFVGNQSWTWVQPFDINPGISWDITDNLNVNPGLVFYPINSNLGTTSAILYISDKLL